MKTTFESGGYMLTRGAGILMPVSALYSEGGIGTLGEAAYDFVDKLKKAGQKYWQVLPLGPTGDGNSPYQPFSAFAGNPYFIDVHALYADGLIRKSELPTGETRYVNYAQLSRSRPQLLRLAFEKFKGSAEFDEFCASNSDWLESYTLFAAVKRHFNGAPYSAWDEDIRKHEPDALKRYAEKLRKEVEFNKFCQYRFFSDWYALRRYANSNGVRIIGDMPIYVSPDGADIWTNPEQFEIDADLRPVKLAGVPPDAFSEKGQLWGNPIYNWEIMSDDGFAWWRKRMALASQMFDVVRIDHFIGLARYYSVSAGSDSALHGRWRRGPGVRLTRALDEVRGDTDIIAENLGVEHPAVIRLLEKTGYCTMNVLEFAFGDKHSRHLPHNYTKNSVAYPATHDNDTLAGWLDKISEQEQRYIADYVGVKTRNRLHDGLLRAVYASVSDLAIVQMQDILGLGSSARMNTPSTVSGNWRWRMSRTQFGDNLIEKLNALAELYGR